MIVITNNINIGYNEDKVNNGQFRVKNGQFGGLLLTNILILSLKMSQTNNIALDFSGQVFAHKLNFISSILVKHNIELSCLLANTSIDTEQLGHCGYKIHKDQVIQFYQNVLQLNIPNISVMLGAAIKPKHYGLYGCTLLCCKNLRQSLAFAIRYHHLVTKTVNMSLHDHSSGKLCFRFEDLLQDTKVAQFNIELQCVIVLSLVRHCLNDHSFTFEHLNLSCNEGNNAELLQDFFGCPISYQQQHNEFLFNHTQWNLKTAQSNPIAMPLLLSQCDNLLTTISSRNEFLKTITHWIKNNMHTELSTEHLANELCMTPRTLRRKLSEQGTSFSSMVKDLRCISAKKLLVETDLTIENIGCSLGFNDVSNFRAAFKKWTGETPSTMRQTN
jgi:AraC-like DNA-binding protein